jgi:hypothetical protein
VTICKGLCYIRQGEKKNDDVVFSGVVLGCVTRRLCTYEEKVNKRSNNDVIQVVGEQVLPSFEIAGVS